MAAEDPDLKESTPHEADPSAPICVDYQALQPDTLRRLIEEFVTRDGTDYGEQEQSLASRVATLRHQLERRRAVVVFDTELDSYDILPIELLGADIIDPAAS
jgi:uncharacterized protein